MQSRGLPVLAVGILLLAACQPAASGTPSVSEIPDPSAPTSEAPPSVEPSAAACTLPATGEATIDRAQITDVTVDQSADVERITFTFGEGTPDWSVEEATPPFVADPSGLEMTVNGSSFLQLVMHGGTRVDPDGVPTYTGPREFEPGFEVVAHLIEGGDFEAVASWYIGLNEDVCPTVSTTADTLVLEFSR
jgi:hypothetical protein